MPLSRRVRARLALRLLGVVPPSSTPAYARTGSNIVAYSSTLATRGDIFTVNNVYSIPIVETIKNPPR